MLVAAEIAGIWLLVSLFDLEPFLAFGVMVAVLAVVVTVFVLRGSRSLSD
ncbi:MAG: hypothetical protein KIT82_11980 [Bradyrhizobium sp.]|nr:hypothetical protein [Bradyrhizobium sp.]